MRQSYQKSISIAFSAVLLLACSAFSTLSAQKSGDVIFDESFVHRIDLQFDQSNYERQLLDN
ncbi:MAG: hypothetical protein AB8F78_17880 [Saprospiraceae bacterium]